MNIDELYAELGVDFQPGDRQIFLGEFADTARSYRSHLGTGGTDEARDTQLEKLAEELGKEMVEFSPKLTAVPLDTQHFNDLHLEVPPYIAGLFQRYNFYLVNFPITVVPRPGGGFVRLECIVEFNPDDPTAERPIAYQIFPREDWQEIIHASQGLKIGLDENLEFKVDPVQAAGLSSVALPIKAEIEQKMAGRAGLILGPFDYDIRRSRILSRGTGNVKVHWRMEGEGSTTQEEPRLGVVLEVPKSTQKLDAIGVLVAYSTFHFFTANVRDVLEAMSNAGGNFFRKGLPISHKMSWDRISADL